MQKYHLGLVSVSFRSHTPEEILKAMKHTALQCIEWGSDVHAPCDDLSRLENIAKLQAEYGITCCSYGTYFRLGTTPITELPQYIRAAKILGTSILRLWCGNKSGKDMSVNERTDLLAECRKATKIARHNDVILCMECHRNTFTENPEDAVWLMKAVNSPYFRMYWQPFQWQNIQQNIENARKIAPYTEHIHVFNWQDTQKPPLAGAVTDWQSYLQCFAKSHTLLLEFMPMGTLEELPAEAESLRQIAGGIV